MSESEFQAALARAAAETTAMGTANFPKYKRDGSWCACDPFAPEGEFYFETPDGFHGWACEKCGRLTQSG